MPTNYLEQAKSLLRRNSSHLLLRAVPLALAAAAAANAAATFSPTITRAVSNCSGGSSVSGSLAGTLANSGHGLVLSGNGSFANPGGESASGCIKYLWSGSGSGTFGASTLPAFWDFTVTQPENAMVYAWQLAFSFDSPSGNVVTVFDCSVRAGQAAAAEALGRLGPTPRTIQQQCYGPISGSASVNVPSTLTTWYVQLQVLAQWFNSSATSVGVNVPAGSSIHINAPFEVPAVPALSPVALGLTALGLMVLAAFAVARWRTVRQP